MATRKQKINEVADKIEAHFDELARSLRNKVSPCKGFAGLGSGFEVGGCVAWCRYTTTFRLAGGHFCRMMMNAGLNSHRKPLGVVGSITELELANDRHLACDSHNHDGQYRRD